jgi:MurNAc alpha-1-phosphate uridylyltransferase
VSKVTAAMIMGAGLGTRMRPLTDDRPKPLVTVGGKTLIDHSIDRLVAAGVTLVVVNLHYKAAMLEAHLAKRHDVEILFSDETEMLLDTGGGVVKAMPHFGDQSFFVLNSDSIWIENGTPVLSAMQAEWDEARMDGLLLLADMKTALGYEGTGDFALKRDGKVIRARDAQKNDKEGGDAIYAYPGVQIVRPRLFTDAPQGAFSTNIMWDRAIAQHRLSGTVMDGTWIHVGTPEARDEAEATLAALSAA